MVAAFGLKIVFPALLLALASPPAASIDPADPAAHGRHLLAPDEVPPGPRIFALAPRAEEGPCPDCGERVEYVALGGTRLELVRHRGRFVDALLSDRWVEGLGVEGVRLFLDTADLTYAYFMELTGREPVGQGRLPIAIVPSACGSGWGCAVRGAKGVEITDFRGLGESFNETVWESTRSGVPHPIVVHELAHNFDHYTARIGNHRDEGHVWTDILEYGLYPWVHLPLGEPAPFRHRVPADLRPGELADHWVERFHWNYLGEPGASWQSCVREETCRLWARQVKAGLVHRVVDLFGLGTLPAFAAELERIRTTRPAPRTAQAKEDEYVEALAAAAGLDLGCAVDQWRWSASPAARERMAARYPPADALCSDLDGDGVTPLLGDCDDDDPTIHPGALEVDDGLDGDCDGVVDEAVKTIPVPRAGNPGEPVGPAPVEVRTRLIDGAPRSFPFEAPPGRLKVTGCSPAAGGYDGGLSLSDEARESLSSGGQTRPGECSTFFGSTEDARGWGRLRLYAHWGRGAAEVQVEPAEPFPVPPWGHVEIERLDGGRYRLTAVAEGRGESPFVGVEPPESVRFWVSGYGWVGERPYSPSTVLEWEPGFDLDPAMHHFRAQPWAGDAPVGGYTLRDEIVPPFPGWLRTEEIPGFEFQVRITAGGAGRAGVREAACLPDTLCVSGALPGRSEVFLRVIGPRPNGFLWPQLVKFSTSEVEAWVRRVSTGEVRYYRLPAVPGGRRIVDLSGLADRQGFPDETIAPAVGPLRASSGSTGDPAVLFGGALASETPPPPPGPLWLSSAEVPGFSFQVRISAGGGSRAGAREEGCLPETLCVSGALPGRSEVFLRIIGPRPNGHLWLQVVKFSTSRIEVWARQEASGAVRYYDLPAVSPGEVRVDLSGLADRLAFSP